MLLAGHGPDVAVKLFEAVDDTCVRDGEADLGGVRAEGGEQGAASGLPGCDHNLQLTGFVRVWERLVWGDSAAPERDEFLEVKELRWSEIGAMIRRGKIRDTKTLTALMFIQCFVRRPRASGRGPTGLS